jgi:hypothetical protein
MSHPVALLNTSILTADGHYEMETISLEDAKIILKGKEVLSAIGHQSTADILSELLGKDVKMNRINFAQEPGQVALVFKLNGRPEERKILSRQEIEEIGYSFKQLVRTH